MRTVNSDRVVRVTLEHKGLRYSTRWYYNLGEREAVKRAKREHGLTGKHGVQVQVS